MMENGGCLMDIADLSTNKLLSPTEKQTSLPQEKEFMNEKTERTSDNLKVFSQQGSIKEKENEKNQTIHQKSTSLSYSETEKNRKTPFEFGEPNKQN